MKPTNIFKSFKPNKPILSLLSIEVLIGILGEIMPDGLKRKIEGLVTINEVEYKEEIWLAAFGATVLVFLWLSLRSEKVDRIETIKPTNLFENERGKIIDSLKERYTERLNQKLDERIAINLGLKYTTVGTDEEFVDTYFVKDAKDEKEIKSKITEVLKEHSYLLIIGEPGAGKTTLLLELAIEMLKQAEENESLPFPVILNLASWRDIGGFEEWLVDGLVNGDGFSRKLASYVLEKRQILPFLDGLDEISDANLRYDCLENLRRFLPKHNPQKIVICSRIDEYKEAEIDAPVRAEILVKPLSLKQVTKLLGDIKDSKIQTSLSTNPTSAANMLRWIDKSNAAKKVFCNPFYFNLASQILDSTNIQAEVPQEEMEITHYLVKTFVDSSLAETTKQFSSGADNKYWISWLANQLKKSDVITFELSTFQPNMLRGRWKYNLLIFLLAYLFIGLILGWFFGAVGLLVCLLYGLGSSWASEARNIETKDIRHLVWVNFFRLKFWLIVLFTGVYSSLLFGFVGGFWIGLLSWFFFNDLISGLMNGFFGGAIFGFVMNSTSLFNNLFLVITNYSKILNPYQRLRSGFIFTIIEFSLVMGVIFFFIFVLVAEISFLLAFFYSMFGLFVGVFYGLALTPLYQHISLRFCFYLEGSMPLRYVDFLYYATRLRILERDGGQWRFRHKILQDYFANLKLENFDKNILSQTLEHRLQS